MSRSAYFAVSLFMCLLIALGTYGGYVYMKKSVSDSLSAEPVLSESVSAADTDEEKEEADTKKVIHDSQKSVVMIETDYGLGSGFLYNEKGDIVTNAHVVEGAETVSVQFSNAEILPGTVIGRSDTVDVALVRVDALKDAEPLPLVEDEYLEVGDEVMALGSPRGLDNTVTTGIISGVDRDFELPPYTYENAYQISAPIAPGSSGGPLVMQKSGQVAGINSAGMTEGDIGFSIPINDVLPMVEKWSENPAETREAASAPVANAAVDEEAAAYVVGYYFDSLNVGDYWTAYDLLSSDWKQGETYDEFSVRNADLGYVEIREADTTIVGDQAKVMFVLIEDEGESEGWYQATYTVEAENDQLVIVDREWESIE
ncbi:S1C family serine protease [Alteribacillus sp. YIM 98480]|uniref:S1C family serine protease n=1 Tax=Alteribacillus sp. YIM 98480 TaxID=2606599 RepID=UPI00131A67A5|nr:trypsin-like peptidase domain-containing protein [Alteribacillus sp. YIM 98480]